MEKTIEIDDATTIRMTMVGYNKWQVAVGRTLVQPEVKKISMFEQDLRFHMPDGRPAIITVRPSAGTKPALDARVGLQDIIDPGPWPFKCPRCRAQVRPRDQYCSGCSAPQPSSEERVQNRGRRSAARGLWRRALSWSVLLVFYIYHAAQRGTLASALASLEQTQPADDATGLTASDTVWFVIMLALAAIIVTAACAVLARRLPATAHWISSAFAISAFVWYVLAAGAPLLPLIWALLTIWTMVRAARYAGSSQRLPFPSP